MFKRIIRKIQHVPVRFTASYCEDVIIESIGNKGVLTLNRPKALNSLNLSMVKTILSTLIEWESEKTLVIVKGAGNKSFCSGADVKAIALGKRVKLGQRFFRAEYTMNGIIGSYKIPYIALIDGITMGGGVGLSVHGKYRVATERTIFAMPETQIALFPDVGASYILPRLSGKLGLFLALTGHRLIGYDNLEAGIATHYVDSESIPELLESLLDCNNDHDVLAALNEFSKSMTAEFSLAPYLKKIDKYFAVDTVEGILKNLKEDGSEWAQDNYELLMKMSPTSMKVSKELLKRGAKMPLHDCLRMEYNVACNTLARNEFSEGVRALLIDKDQSPKWIPNTLEDVSDSLVKEHFKSIPNGLAEELICNR